MLIYSPLPFEFETAISKSQAVILVLQAKSVTFLSITLSFEKGELASHLFAAIVMTKL